MIKGLFFKLIMVLCEKVTKTTTVKSKLYNKNLVLADRRTLTGEVLGSLSGTGMLMSTIRTKLVLLL